MIVVAGGTGMLGSRLVNGLAGQGLAVRVVTRDLYRAAHLAAPGVEAICGDVRDRASLDPALRGASIVISAVQGFAGPRGVSPTSVDQAGNANLISAAARAGADFVLVSVVGASPAHPMELFRAKHAAEETLRGSGIAWTIVQATAFMETWGTILGRRLPDSGKILVFGRGDNPINFVSATDVAALLSRVVTSPSLRGQVLQLGGPDNLTFNQFAVILQQATGCCGTIGHIPRSVLRTIALTAGQLKPALARQARAALVMDSLRMTFDPAPTRRALPGLPETALLSALTECWPGRARSRGQG